MRFFDLFQGLRMPFVRAAAVFASVFFIAAFAYHVIQKGIFDDAERTISESLQDGLGITVLFAGAATLTVAAFDHFASRKERTAPADGSASRLRGFAGSLAMVAAIVLLAGTVLVIATEDVEPTDLITGLGTVDDLNNTVANFDSTVEDDFTPVVNELKGTVRDLDETSKSLTATTDDLDEAVKKTTAATDALTTRVDVVEDSADRAEAAAGAVEAAAEGLTSSLTEFGSGQERLEQRMAEIVERLDAAFADPDVEPASTVGPCDRGLEASIGESCSYPQLGLQFVVSEDGASFLAPTDAEPQRGYVQADLIVRGEQHALQAVEEAEGRWRIYAAGLWQSTDGVECQVGGRVEPGEYCTWRGNTLRVYATNDFVSPDGNRAQFSRGYAHLDLQYYRDAYNDRLISVSDDFEDKQGNPVSRKFIAQRDPESDARAWIIICAD